MIRMIVEVWDADFMSADERVGSVSLRVAPPDAVGAAAKSSARRVTSMVRAVSP